MRPALWVAVFAAGLWCGAAASDVIVAQGAAQNPQSQPIVQLPKDAIGLEGVPTVRIDATEQRVTRRALRSTEGAHDRLRITIQDGRYFWASRGNVPLTMMTSGDYTYLSSAEPGKYVRFHRINDRLMYVEHVDMPIGSVTYWGELRVLLGQ